MSLLSVKNLNVEFRTHEGIFSAVNDVSFNLNDGETLGIVGESGSGKSVTCMALLKLLPIPPAHITQGSVIFEGIDLIQANEKSLRKIRGKRISMIFQDPMTSLNPYLKIGKQLIEPLMLHGLNSSLDVSEAINKKSATKRAIALLDEVGIENPSRCINQYPHELSGGMRQRVMIAMALITEPDILIADEPTTALDVTVQAQILTLIKRLKKQRKFAVIFISHDLLVVNKICEKVLIMKQGHIVESGNTSEVFEAPQNEYTKRLLQSIPTSAKPEALRYKNESNESTLALQIQNISIKYNTKPKPFIAVENANLEIANGEVLGLVGESGCGKSTLSQSIVGLINISTGSIQLNKHRVDTLSSKEFLAHRQTVQMIFQDPYASLNPRMTAFETLAEPVRLYRDCNQINVHEHVLTLMQEVGLDQNWLNKYPHEFSGGQRQRIAIARALAVQPKIIIADEAVSALDVTIQSQILDLLLNLCQRYQMTMLFISHDLAVVRYVADRIAVMKNGKIVESGNTETVFNNPQHHYTQTLLAAVHS